MLRAVGRAIEGLGGRFLAGRDVGIAVHDGAVIREETRFMVDESTEGVGDLNRATAVGVAAGARAALAYHSGRAEWDGTRVAIQGVGGVGSWLARLLAAEGARILAADTHAEALDALGNVIALTRVDPEAILTVACDVLAPCAIGNVIDTAQATSVRASVVAGSANNILASPDAGDVLSDRGVTYAPDFLINAGALIQGVRFLTLGERASDASLQAIGERTTALLTRAAVEALPPERLLEREVDQRFGRVL